MTDPELHRPRSRMYRGWKLRAKFRAIRGWVWDAENRKRLRRHPWQTYGVSCAGLDEVKREVDRIEKENPT